MSNDSSTYGMTPAELSSFLAEQRENGFQGLPQKHRLFALEFSQSGSYIDASKKAEIGKETGRNLLRDPLVTCFINYLNQQKEHYTLIDAGFIESQYLQLFAKLTGEEEVPVVDKNTGAQLYRHEFNGPAAVSALRDMAKISGHYKEDGTLRVELGVSLNEDQKRLLDKALDELY